MSRRRAFASCIAHAAAIARDARILSALVTRDASGTTLSRSSRSSLGTSPALFLSFSLPFPPCPSLFSLSLSLSPLFLFVANRKRRAGHEQAFLIQIRQRAFRGARTCPKFREKIPGSARDRRGRNSRAKRTTRGRTAKRRRR